jgi:hypothetical protein
MGEKQWVLLANKMDFNPHKSFIGYIYIYNSNHPIKMVFIGLLPLDLTNKIWDNLIDTSML